MERGGLNWGNQLAVSETERDLGLNWGNQLVVRERGLIREMTDSVSESDFGSEFWKWLMGAGGI